MGKVSELQLIELFPQISNRQVDLMREYIELLKSYNQKLNLVSRSDIENVWENHIFPSVLVEKCVHFPAGVAIADIGSGGGVPGIPLKIVRPDLELVLLDSSRKKTAFLRKVIHQLSLTRIAVVTVRLGEGELMNEFKYRFPVVMARAVGDFFRLVTLSRPLLVPDGYLLAWKGEQDLAELKKVAMQQEWQYEVLRLPESYTVYSAKMSHLRYVKVWADKDQT